MMRLGHPFGAIWGLSARYLRKNNGPKQRHTSSITITCCMFMKVYDQLIARCLNDLAFNILYISLYNGF